MSDDVAYRQYLKYIKSCAKKAKSESIVKVRVNLYISPEKSQKFVKSQLVRNKIGRHTKLLLYGIFYVRIF